MRCEEENEHVLGRIHGLTHPHDCVAQAGGGAEGKAVPILEIVDQLQRPVASAQPFREDALAEERFTAEYTLIAVTREAEIVEIGDARALRRQSRHRFVDEARLIEEDRLGVLPRLRLRVRVVVRRFAPQMHIGIEIHIPECNAEDREDNDCQRRGAQKTVRRARCAQPAP